MPGIVSQFVLLDLVRNRLTNSGNPKQKAIADTITAEPAFAYLGALGPDLLDFMPNNLTPGVLGGASPYTMFWQIVYGIANGTTSGSTVVPSLVKTLAKINDLLNQLDTIASNQDLGALENFKNSGGVDQVQKVMADLATIVNNIGNIAGNLMANIKLQQPLGSHIAIGQPVPPPIAWDCRDFLYWKHTGEFAAELISSAQSSGDNRFLAYAYGYSVGFTAKVCGSPFLNSILGSTYRLNWWRQRWLNMFGDEWVWGYYTSSSTPAAPFDYTSWPSLCKANLQQRIELPGIDPQVLLDIVTLNSSSQNFPAVLPDDFAQFWFSAFKQVYGPVPTQSRFSAVSLNGAYLLTWLMLWFQTSGLVLGCNSAPPMAPSGAACGSNPPWVDPTTAPPGAGGTPQLPPSPSVEQDPSVGDIVCGAILALLGLAGMFFGNFAAGGAALAGGVDLIITGASQINWDNLKCQLYWYHLYLYNGLNALHQAAMLVGIVHPYGPELATDQITINLLGLTLPPFDSGDRIVPCRGNVRPFPAGLWVPGILPDWTSNPTATQELPAAVPYVTNGAYPNYWMDDATNNPLGNGQVRIGGTWPVDMTNKSDFPVQFGNAVDNSIDVLLNPKSLPDWNLDADRGLAYFTWQFNGNYANPVQIEPES